MSNSPWRWRKKKARSVNIVKAAWLKKIPCVSLNSQIAKLDKIFSRFKRLEALMPAGYIRCFTCGAFISFRESDNGHYIGRENMGTRYCEKNTAPQCRDCNRFSEGNKSAFAINLQRKYGPGILEELEKQKQEGRFITKTRLDELTTYYQARVKQLEAEKLGGH